MKFIDTTLHLLVPTITVGFMLAAANRQPAPTVRWQWDDARKIRREADVKNAWAKEFNRTNTNPSMVAVFTSSYFPIAVTPNEVEYGYRSDGVVVWRVPPEAK